MQPSELAYVCGRFSVQPGHPCLAGHFPGDPLVPGVLLLDHALGLLARAAPGLAAPGHPQEVTQLRFRTPVRPGEVVEVRHGARRGERLALAGFVAGRLAFSGRLRLAAPAA